MKVYVRCERCSKEGEPCWVGGNYGQLYGQGMATPGQWALPATWAAIDNKVLCGDCVPVVRSAIVDALARTPAKAQP